MEQLSETIPLNIKIKKEKITPERELEKIEKGKSEIDKLLELRLFENDDTEDDKKNIENLIEPIKSSRELLDELFGVFGSQAPPELSDDLKKKIKKEKKKKKKSDKDKDKDLKHKKSKKKKRSSSKEKESTETDNDNELPKQKKIKIEPPANIKKEHKQKDKDKERQKSPEKSSVRASENKKTTSRIVIKDLHNSTIFKSTTTKTSTKVKHDKEKERDRDKKKHKKSSGRKNHDSDLSLSDEDTYKSYRESLEFYKGSDHHKDYKNRRDRSLSRDRNREWIRTSDREWDRGKERLWDRDYYDREHERERNHRRSRSRNRDRFYSRSNDTKDRSRSPIDKKKLLEIARKNAITMLKSGTLPTRMTEADRQKLMAKIKNGGKTVQELTEYCRKLSSKEEFGELSSLSEDSDIDGDGKERAFHHPFELKDRGPIVMNIRNSVPIPPKQAGQLKAIMSQFPVSSGKQHQAVESEWVPVTTSSTTSLVPTTSNTVATISKPAAKPQMTLQKQIEEQLPELVPSTNTNTTSSDTSKLNSVPYDWKSDDHYTTAVPPFADAGDNIDVSQIISQRLNAMRKLQENPHDSDAVKLLYDTQKNMSAWATSKYTPGQFLGSTDVKVLSAKELSSGYQAWAKKNQMLEAEPLTSGMGMHLLQKMGWKPGEGLGKDKSGALQPLLLEVKLDKRGLEANEELLHQQYMNGGNKHQKGKGRSGGGGGGHVPRMTLEGKHPVSLLHELSSKRRWGVPSYEVSSESGPAHAKCFIFKVRVNGIEYTAPSGCNNKKEAKAAVAKFCLQQLGVLP